MRLGKYPCTLKAGTVRPASTAPPRYLRDTATAMRSTTISRPELAKNGLVFSGLSPDERLVEMIELTDHPYFVACRFHPELKSRPDKPHPLFVGLVEAMIKRSELNGGGKKSDAENAKERKANAGKSQCRKCQGCISQSHSEKLEPDLQAA